MYLKRVLCILLSCTMLTLTGCGLVDKVKEKVTGSSDVSDMFQDALKNKNVEYLNEIIARYPDYDINECDRGNSLWTSLYNNGDRGSDMRNMNFSKALLEAGADPNGKQIGGDYLLITACDNDFWYAPALLLEYGADVNIEDSGESALYLVLRNWSGGREVTCIKTAKLLVENGAEVTSDLFNINKDDYEDMQYNHIERSPVVANYLMNILHEKGESTNMPSAVEYAVSGNFDKTIEYVENGEELTDSEKTLICEYAHYYGTPDDINRLYELFGIEEPIYVKLERIVECGNLEVVKYLTQNFEDKANDDYSDNYLEIAVAYGYEDVFNYLRDNTSLTAHSPSLLKCALYYDDIDLFRTVYECIEEDSEIDENFISDLGCLLNGKFEYIDYLMDIKNHSMVMVTLEDVDYETAKYMFDKGRPINITDLDYAMYHADPEYMKLVLDNGADVNQKCYFIDYLVYFEELFYEEGADYSNFIEKYQTREYSSDSSETLSPSFQYLLKYCSGDCVKVMIDYGAEMNDDILKGSYEFSYGVVKTLIDNGANTKLKFDVLKPRQGSIVKSGEFDLEEYYEYYGREDLVELVK